MWDPVTAAFSICKGRTHPLDVASVLQPASQPRGSPDPAPPPRRFFSFLSTVYGLWANIDIGTEAHRCGFRCGLGGCC